jgi:hypothetical protein
MAVVDLDQHYDDDGDGSADADGSTDDFALAWANGAG